MSDRQNEQERLVEEASKLPGVADAVAVYGRIHALSVPVVQAVPTMVYATGGNAS